MDKIFEPFQQAGQVNLDKPVGTGLGLAISRRLVELHGGTLAAQSELGQGSRFTISLLAPALKIDRKAWQNRRGTAGTERHQSHDEKILLVEDNELNVKLMETVLEPAGYNMHAEMTGEGGLEAALKKQYDLILMDIQLPDITGVEAKIRIRDKLRKKIPIVAFTSFAMKEDAERFLAEGLDGYISKPVDVQKLLQKIEKLLEG